MGEDTTTTVIEVIEDVTVEVPEEKTAAMGITVATEELRRQDQIMNAIGSPLRCHSQV